MAAEVSMSNGEKYGSESERERVLYKVVLTGGNLCNLHGFGFRILDID